MSDGRVEAAEPCRSSSSSSSLSKNQHSKPEELQQQQQKQKHHHHKQHHHHRDHQQQNQQQQHHQHHQRKPRLKSQTSESLVSAGDASVKSTERRRPVHEEETAENKRIAYIVATATGLIFFAAFILIAVTLKMTPKIDEIHLCKSSWVDWEII